MGKFFKNVLCVLYQYYNKGATQSVAYDCALSGLLIILYLNLMTLLIFLKIDFRVFFFENLSKVYKYIVILVISSPFFFLLKKKYPKSEILNCKPNLHYSLSISLFFTYVIISLFLFIIALKQME